MNRKNVGCIYETNDYSIFNIKKGNREVTSKRAKKLRESILKYGWIMNPIICNEKMEVIDGQGRLEALRTLGLPVQFIIIVGAGDRECVALNASNTSWTMNDYIRLYAENGNDDYIRFKALIDEYGIYGYNAIAFAATGLAGLNQSVVKAGNLKCSATEYINGTRILGQLEPFKGIIKNIRGSKTYMATALIFALGSVNIDNEKLLTRMRAKIDEIPPTAKVDQALKTISEIYNYRSRDEKVYLDVEYDQYMNGKYQWYEKKWGKHK